jgi:hypothetical protein
LFREGQSTEGRAELYGDATGVDPDILDSGITEGESCGGDREMGVPVGPPSGLAVDELFGLEVIDLGGDT